MGMACTVHPSEHSLLVGVSRSDDDLLPSCVLWCSTHVRFGQIAVHSVCLFFTTRVFEMRW